MVGGYGRRGRCGVLERGTERVWEFGGRREVSVEEGARGGLVRCTVIEAGGAVVLWGDNFPFLCFFCSGGNHLLSRGRRERD